MMTLQVVMTIMTACTLLRLVAVHDVLSYIVFVCAVGMLLRSGLTLYWPLYLTVAHKVEFNAERVEFYGLFGGHVGGLPREAMQQIAVERTKSEKHPVTFHHFLADTGYMPAFPTRQERNALVRNNLLMAAYAQPVHLDLAAYRPTYGTAVPPTPDIHDLRPLQ